MSDISVRKRGEKWYYSFEAASIEGKRKRIERVGGKTKKEALEKGIQALNEYNNAGVSFEPNQVSVSDFLDYYIDNFSRVNNKYRTQVNDVGNIELYLKPLFGQYRLCNLSTGPIQEFINKKMVSGAAKSTVQGALAPLSQAYEFAIDLGYVKDNPCKRVKYPTGFKDRKSRYIIPIEEYNKIINSFTEKQKYFKIAIMIGWYSGLRISETFGLTWDDIDFKNKTITVNKQIVKRDFGTDVRRGMRVKKVKNERSAWYFEKPKTVNSNRTIMVSDDLLSELNKYRKAQLSNKIYYGEYYNELYLKDETDEKGKTIHRIVPIEKGIPCSLPVANMIFRKENGEYVSTDSFKYASRMIHYRLFIKEFDYHSLRHTHATMLIESGVSPKSVQERLGHSNIETTFNSYVHNTEKMKLDAVEKFDEIMRNQG